MSDGTGHLSKLVWSVADLLRGDFRSSEYGRVILPFTVLRRLDCLLAPSRQAVLDEAERTDGELEREQRLTAASGWPFYNVSRFSMESVLSDPENADRVLLAHVDGYSRNVRELLAGFEFERTVTRLHQAQTCWSTKGSPSRTSGNFRVSSPAVTGFPISPSPLMRGTPSCGSTSGCSTATTTGPAGNGSGSGTRPTALSRGRTCSRRPNPAGPGEDCRCPI